MAQRDASSQAINLIVNSTPLGMTPNVNASPWPEGLSFPGNTFVYDLIYSPAETRLMRQARAAGRRTANGLGMLVRQGALAFQLWTGLEPDIRIMANAVMQGL
jgi:shikimate dehydrogenase